MTEKKMLTIKMIVGGGLAFQHPLAREDPVRSILSRKGLLTGIKRMRIMMFTQAELDQRNAVYAKIDGRALPGMKMGE